MSELSVAGASLFIVLAFFLKGFSGFGPALVMIPTLSLLIKPETAISASAFFDMIAGFLMMITVYRNVDWKFVLPVTSMLMIGTFPGVILLKSLSTDFLKILIAGGIMVFILVLLFSDNEKSEGPEPSSHWLQYPIALVSGFAGGVIGITSPLLVIYLKLRYRKEYFRTQLIAVFFFAAIWRFYLFQSHGITLDIAMPVLFLMGCAVILGLYAGYNLHLRVNEKRFTRIVALVLIIPAVNLLYSGWSGLLRPV